MIIDANSRDDTQSITATYDVCIAGAGVAGITIAQRLAKKGKSVVLLEGGGLVFSEKSQQLYEGTIVGHEYFPLTSCRLRYFGGTSNHWAGWCRSLDAYDFHPKPHVEWSGWPIEKKDLAKYEDETYRILEIPNRIRRDRDFPPSKGTLKEIKFAFSPPVRFGEKYFKVLDEAEAISVVLNANWTDIQIDSGSGVVKAFIAKNFRPGSDPLVVTARNFVLALGGIENARTLLNTSPRVNRGIGNRHDLVGRFFMEHPHFYVGIYFVTDKTVSLPTFLSPTQDFILKNRVLNCGLRVHAPENEQLSLLRKTKKYLKELACELELIRTTMGLSCNFVPAGWGRLRAIWEQAPNPSSRVKLSEERDQFGLRKVELDWRLSEIDRHTARLCAIEFGKALARVNAGRLKLYDWVLDDQAPYPSLRDGEKIAGCHHMGTTRMADSPRKGVVDRNCRVFDTKNLYVAGSSVFPTTGHANPTYTIVQLALRLADHLASLG